MNNRTVIRIIALLLVMPIALGCTACKVKNGPLDTPTEEPETQTTLVNTEEPEPTAVPEPTDTPEPTEPANTSEVARTSNFTEYTDAARAFLSGDRRDWTPYLYWLRNSEVSLRFGRYEDGTASCFAAYDTCIYDQDGGLSTFKRFEHPLYFYPEEAAAEAWNSLKQRVKDHLFGHDPYPDQDGDDFTVECFGGEDWFMLLSDKITAAYQVHTIWRTSDGENYSEFGCNDEAALVTGACILNEDVGFMCCTGPYEEGHGFKVFGTFDGGREWKDLGLTVPEEYSGYFLSSVYSPTFDGSHGVMLVSLEYEDGRPTKNAVFESFDLGRSWTFVDPAK